MPNNDQSLFSAIQDAATATAQQELDAQLDRITEGVEAARAKKKAEDNNFHRQYCVEGPNNGVVLSHPNKTLCEEAGGHWVDRRKAYQKIKDKYEKARDYMPNHLERASQKMKNVANTILENSNPRNKTARKTDYIDLNYGAFREACANGDESLIFPNYDGGLNPLRLKRKLWGGKKFEGTPEEVNYTEDANMYMGPTKVSVQRAITSDMPMPSNPKDQVAAFTMAIKKITWTNVDPNNPSKGDLEITFYTMPGANSVFPNNDFSAFIPLELSDNRYDDETIQLGRYINTGAASVDFMTSFHQAWRYDTINRMGADSANLIGKIIDVANEEILSREFFCCIFFEIMAANPEISEMIGDDIGLDPSDLGKIKIKFHEKKIEEIKKDENWADNPDKVAAVQGHEEKILYYEQHGYSVQDFLNEQKGWMTKLKNIITIIVGLLQGNSFQFGWPALSINILQILINSVYAVLMIVLEEIQAHVLKECYDWVAEKKAEADAKVKETLEHEGSCSDELYFNRTDCQQNGGIWEPGATWETAAINCLPWEQILIVVIDSLFGNDGLFKHIKGFVDRVTADMLLKTKQLDSQAYDVDESLDDSKFIKYLLQALDILDWLLSLNADAVQLCNRFSRNLDALGPDHYQQTVEDTMNGLVDTGGQTIISGDPGDTVGNPDALTGNIPGSGAGDLSSSGRTPSDYHSSSKIDITGNIVNPLGLLLYQTDNDIKKFFTQYIGLTPEEAAEAVTGEKRGQCMKKLSEADAQQLKQILNNTKMEI